MNKENLANAFIDGSYKTMSELPIDYAMIKLHK